MADQGMPTTYETQTQQPSQSTLGFNKDYIMSLPGILKIAEILLSFITFICGVAGWWRTTSAGGWVNFVAISSTISTLIMFIFYVIGLYGKLPNFRLIIEFVYYCVFTGLFLIAAIVAAAQASASAGVGACAFFAFAATAVYAVDTFFQFRAYRSGQMNTQTTTTSGQGQGQGHEYNPEAGKVTY